MLFLLLLPLRIALDIALIATGFDLAVLFYLVVYLPYIAKIHLEWNVYCPRAIPAATIAGVIAWLRCEGGTREVSQSLWHSLFLRLLCCVSQLWGLHLADIWTADTAHATGVVPRICVYRQPHTRVAVVKVLPVCLHNLNQHSTVYKMELSLDSSVDFSSFTTVANSSLSVCTVTSPFDAASARAGRWLLTRAVLLQCERVCERV